EYLISWPCWLDRFFRVNFRQCRTFCNRIHPANIIIMLPFYPYFKHQPPKAPPTPLTEPESVLEAVPMTARSHATAQVTSPPTAATPFCSSSVQRIVSPASVCQDSPGRTTEKSTSICL